MSIGLIRCSEITRSDLRRSYSRRAAFPAENYEKFGSCVERAKGSGGRESIQKTTPDPFVRSTPLSGPATPLLTAKSPISGKVHTVAWINNYHGTRVFCTTLGHDMKTGADPAYIKLLANGILWACGKPIP